MARLAQRGAWLLIATPLLLALFPLASVAQTGGKPMVYWCPNRTPDQQYTTRAEPGCIPVVEEKSSDKTKDDGGKQTPGREINLDRLEAEVTQFIQRYNRFLGCCATDPIYLKQLTGLQEDADEILAAVRADLPVSQIKLRGVAFTIMLETVSRARYDLANLKERLEGIKQAKKRMNDLGYEAAGRERRKIQLEQQAIRRDFRPLTLPSAGHTGTNIGETSLSTRYGEETEASSLPRGTGEAITGNGNQPDLQPRTGGEVGETPTFGPDIGQTPAKGFAIGGEKGPTGASSLPSRAGPGIGDSSLNK